MHQNSLGHTIGSHHGIATGHLLVDSTPAMTMEGVTKTATAKTAMATAAMVGPTVTVTAMVVIVGATATVMDGVMAMQW